jgi:hypothetical protein
MYQDEQHTKEQHNKDERHNEDEQHNEEVSVFLGPTAHPGLPIKVFLGVGRCRRL